LQAYGAARRLSRIDGWDHLELYVGNAKQAAFFYERAFGFTPTAYAGPETGIRDRASYVLEQDDIRFVLTTGLRPDSELTRFPCAHGDGVKDVALTVPDAAAAYRHTVEHGARGVVEPHWVEDEWGRVQLATIATYGENVHTFVTRSEYSGPYLPGYREIPRTNGRPATGVGLKTIDHVVGNVELGRMNYWVEFYERTMGFTNIIHFGDEQIHTEYSALMSKVMADGEGKIKFPINEPAEGKRKSQIDEYLEYFGGPGVQHVALLSDDIVRTSRRCRSAASVSSPRRTRTTRRRGRGRRDRRGLGRPQALRILVDRDEEGYLLQIFTKTAQDRPTLFFEVIERHGARGFGEGNFKALFEAIEREQALRGNL
jgi:4-hydroxyphenylpyruvate dioxygenase